MQATTVRPPKTIMELFKMLPEGTLAEVIEGSIYMSPAPNVPHQALVGELYVTLTSIVKRIDFGNVFISPLDVFLDENENVVQPDILLIAKKNRSIIREDAIHGSPDVILEILSPGNSMNDRSRKKKLYEKFGVNEYWIVDPQTREAIGHILVNGVYQELPGTKNEFFLRTLNETVKF